jgi:Uma2 family endonuclease
MSKPMALEIGTSSGPPADGDDSLYEVVNGQRVELASKGTFAALLATTIASCLREFLVGRGLGRVAAEGLFVLDADKDLRRRPDVAVVSAERWPMDQPIPKEGDWAVIPDLAVEVISPNDLVKSVTHKGNCLAHTHPDGRTLVGRWGSGCSRGR